MKKIQTTLLTVLFLIAPAVIRANNTVTIVDVPNREATNVNYTNFRAPLQQAPLLKLPVGMVQPRGWLRKYLELQRDGLNGQLGTVSAWLDKNNNQWLSNQGDQKKEVEIWIQAVLNNQTSNGRLGPDGYDGDSPDIWAKMPMLWALQTYYEATGSQRVLTAMNRYFKWEMSIPDNKFLKGLWQEKRGGDNLWSVLWLYNRNGDKTILPLIDKLHNAISENKKISFQYFKWDLDFSNGTKIVKTARKGGAAYKVSPWALCWDDENYYLVAYDSEAEMIKHYRVDKMERIRLLKEERDGSDKYKDFNPARYAKSVFSMFGGEECEVKLQVDNDFIGIIVDRFGSDIYVVRHDEHSFTVNVHVMLSPQFYAWLFGLSGKVKILSPEKAIIEFKNKIMQFAL